MFDVTELSEIGKLAAGVLIFLLLDVVKLIKVSLFVSLASDFLFVYLDYP